MEREEPKPGNESSGFRSQPCLDLLGDLRKPSCSYKMRALGHIDIEPQFQLWGLGLKGSRCSYSPAQPVWMLAVGIIDNLHLWTLAGNSTRGAHASRHLCAHWLGSCTNPCFFLLLCLNSDEHELCLAADESSHPSGSSVSDRWIGGDVSSSLVGEEVLSQKPRERSHSLFNKCLLSNTHVPSTWPKSDSLCLYCNMKKK